MPDREWEEMLYRRFVSRWLIGAAVIVIAAILWHWEEIWGAVGNNLWTVISAAMPCVIIAGAIVFMLKSVFK